jgi:hypothetical protein
VCRVPFSYFAHPDSFSAVPRASGPVFMFCAPGLFFGRTECVMSCFPVLRSQTRFRRYRGRRVPFSAIPRALGPVFMFCAPEHVFGGVEGVRSHFHVLRALTRLRLYRGRRLPFTCFEHRTHFRRYRGRQASFSCFALLDPFSAVPRASCPVFMFCTP